MARRAARVPFDPVFLHEHRAENRLLHRGAVVHREHLAAGPDVLLWIAVTVQTPFHLERLHLPHQGHLVDTPVTGFAAHPLLHVDAVVEVDEVRQVVDSDPAQGTVLPEAGADRLEDWRVRPVGGMPANDEVSTEVWQ